MDEAEEFVPVFVGSGTFAAATGAAAVVEFVGASDVGLGWSRCFFLRPNKPRRPRLTWASASGAMDR